MKTPFFVLLGILGLMAQAQAAIPLTNPLPEGVHAIQCTTASAGTVAGYRPRLATGGYGFCIPSACQTPAYDADPVNGKCVKAAVASWFSQDQTVERRDVLLVVRASLNRPATGIHKVAINAMSSTAVEGVEYSFSDLSEGEIPEAIFDAGQTLSRPITLKIVKPSSAMGSTKIVLGLAGSAAQTTINLLSNATEKATLSLAFNDGEKNIVSATTGQTGVKVNVSAGRVLSMAFATKVKVLLNGAATEVLIPKGKSIASLDIDVPTVETIVAASIASPPSNTIAGGPVSLQVVPAGRLISYGVLGGGLVTITDSKNQVGECTDTLCEFLAADGPVTLSASPLSNEWLLDSWTTEACDTLEGLTCTLKLHLNEVKVSFYKPQIELLGVLDVAPGLSANSNFDQTCKVYNLSSDAVTAGNLCRGHFKGTELFENNQTICLYASGTTDQICRSKFEEMKHYLDSSAYYLFTPATFRPNDSSPNFFHLVGNDVHFSYRDENNVARIGKVDSDGITVTSVGLSDSTMTVLNGKIFSNVRFGNVSRLSVVGSNGEATDLSPSSVLSNANFVMSTVTPVYLDGKYYFHAANQGTPVIVETDGISPENTKFFNVYASKGMRVVQGKVVYFGKTQNINQWPTSMFTFLPNGQVATSSYIGAPGNLAATDPRYSFIGPDGKLYMINMVSPTAGSVIYRTDGTTIETLASIDHNYIAGMVQVGDYFVILNTLSGQGSLSWYSLATGEKIDTPQLASGVTHSNSFKVLDNELVRQVSIGTETGIVRYSAPGIPGEYTWFKDWTFIGDSKAELVALYTRGGRLYARSTGVNTNKFFELDVEAKTARLVYNGIYAVAVGNMLDTELQPTGSVTNQDGIIFVPGYDSAIGAELFRFRIR